MSAIGTLVSFVPGSKAVSADVNANFSAIRSAFNTSAVLTDTATTITVTHTFSVSQRFGGDPGIVLTATASRIVPGGTTLALRNSGNSLDNLLITDIGTVSIRNGLTITAGHLGVGAVARTDNLLYATDNLSGGVNNTYYGAYVAPIFPSDATAWGRGIQSAPQTAPGTFTVSQAALFYANDPILGAGSAITTLYGLYVESLTKGGTNVAIKTNAGLVQFGGNVTCAAALNVAGTMTVSTALSAPTLVVTTAGTVGAVALGINNDPTSGFYIASGGVQVAASGTNVSDMRASLWQAAVKARAVAGFIVGNGATLATSATIGYIYVPTTPGTATGVPTIGTVETGTVALAFDTTNNRLQIYNSGWKTVALT